MGSFILRVIFNAAALWVASWVLPGMDITSTAASDAVARTGISQDTDTIGIVLAYLFIGLIFGVVNALVRPLVSLLALPITILTLGLFAIVINAAMLYLTAWIEQLHPRAPHHRFLLLDGHPGRDHHLPGVTGGRAGARQQALKFP